MRSFCPRNRISRFLSASNGPCEKVLILRKVPFERFKEGQGSSIADVVGGDYFPVLIDVLKSGGRYGTSGAIAGPIVDLDLRTLYLRDLVFHGCTVTALNVFPDLVGYIERGEIEPLLAASYPLENFHDAQRAFIDKKHTGNIVVTMERQGDPL